MRIAHFITLLDKAKTLLEKIDTCQNLITDGHNYLNQNRSAPWFQYTSPQYRQQIKEATSRMESLKNDYHDIMIQIVKPVFDNMSNVKVIRDNQKPQLQITSQIY